MAPSATAGRGTVMYLAPNSYMALRYEGAAVIVTNDLIRRDYQPDDIVEFDAGAISNKDALTYSSSGLKPKWKATRVKFVKHAQIITGEGKVLNIDTKGEFCFIEHTYQGTKYNIFCTRINFQPAVPDINSVIRAGSTVRFVAKEQAPTLKNNVKWRAVAVTDLKHELKERMIGKTRTFEAVAYAGKAAGAAKSASDVNIKMAPSSATVRSASKSQAAPAPSAPSALSPLVRVPSASSSVVSSRVASPVRMSSLAPAVPTAVTTGLAHLSLNGSDSVDSARAPHPLPSYDWMKFDLINVLRTYPDAGDNEMLTENQKLRAIAHHLTNNTCNFCLSH